jgi:hypothetical protein
MSRIKQKLKNSNMNYKSISQVQKPASIENSVIEIDDHTVRVKRTRTNMHSNNLSIGSKYQSNLNSVSNKNMPAVINLPRQDQTQKEFHISTNNRFGGQ